jgi:hypothetical protein
MHRMQGKNMTVPPDLQELCACIWGSCMQLPVQSVACVMCSCRSNVCLLHTHDSEWVCLPSVSHQAQLHKADSKLNCASGPGDIQRGHRCRGPPGHAFRGGDRPNCLHSYANASVLCLHCNVAVPQAIFPSQQGCREVVCCRQSLYSRREKPSHRAGVGPCQPDFHKLTLHFLLPSASCACTTCQPEWRRRRDSLARSVLVLLEGVKGSPTLLSALCDCLRRPAVLPWRLRCVEPSCAGCSKVYVRCHACQQSVAGAAASDVILVALFAAVPLLASWFVLRVTPCATNRAALHLPAVLWRSAVGLLVTQMQAAPATTVSSDHPIQAQSRLLPTLANGCLNPWHVSSGSDAAKASNAHNSCCAS